MGSDNREDLIDFIRSYRQPVPIGEAASELAALGAMGCDWPRASYEQWIREFEKLVDNGKLNLIEGMLSVSVTRMEEPPQQLTLF